MKKTIYIPSLATMLRYIMVLTCVIVTLALNWRQPELTISLGIVIPLFSGLILAIKVLSPYVIVSESELILETYSDTTIYDLDSINKFSIIFTATIVMTLELFIHNNASDKLLIYKTDFASSVGSCRRFAEQLKRATGRDVCLTAYLMKMNGKLYEYPDMPAPNAGKCEKK